MGFPTQARARALALPRTHSGTLARTHQRTHNGSQRTDSRGAELKHDVEQQHKYVQGYH